MNPYEYAEAHREEFLGQLKDFLSIPSISTLERHAVDIQRAAHWVAEQLDAIGMTSILIGNTKKHPIVTGSWTGAPADAPTVLVYGHYDVQPVDPLHLWVSDPFTPTIRNGNLYARGASDDKGQVFTHIKAIETLMKANGGSLPFNVKFLVEGEEEIGSENLDNFILTHKDQLRADVCVISDSHNLALDRPVIIYGLRGLLYMELEVSGPSLDLHSGTYGGTVHNPLQALCEIIAKLHNDDGSVNVKGFYDNVPAISKEERKALNAIAYTEEEWRAETGAPQSWGEKAFTLRERTGARPTLEVHGLFGGFMGEGSKTVIPTKGTAKISCRLVAEQDPYEIETLVRAQIAAIAPPTIRWELRALSYGWGSVVPIDSPAMQAAIDAYERGYGARPQFLREGGSIPVVATLRKIYGIPVLLMGFGLPDDGAHSPNEKFNLEGFYRGITTLIALYEKLGSMKANELNKR
ncbi:MAG TPA: dipeptidase [Aggregatilineales bacterium]|nr:dipeptidase [Aggregatilineales bacterium]